jgi:hypothetical protein
MCGLTTGPKAVQPVKQGLKQKPFYPFKLIAQVFCYSNVISVLLQHSGGKWVCESNSSRKRGSAQNSRQKRHQYLKISLVFKANLFFPIIFPIFKMIFGIILLSKK